MICSLPAFFQMSSDWIRPKPDSPVPREWADHQDGCFSAESDDDEVEPELTTRQVGSLCTQVRDVIEALPRPARKDALLRVLQTCCMSPYFDRSLPQEIKVEDEDLRIRISRKLKRRRFPSPVHPRVRPRFPGKADQLERKLAWEARESIRALHDAPGDMFNVTWDAKISAKAPRVHQHAPPEPCRSPSPATLGVDEVLQTCHPFVDA